MVTVQSEVSYEVEATKAVGSGSVCFSTDNSNLWPSPTALELTP